jgi:hypothetical protein
VCVCAMAAATTAPKVVDSRKSDDAATDSSDFQCHECGRAGEVVCCDTCDRVFHLACIGSVTDADHMPSPWWCHLCTSGARPGMGGIWAAKAGPNVYDVLSSRKGTCFD